MAIKNDILQDALKSTSHPKKVSLYSRMKLIEASAINENECLENSNKLTTNWQQSENKTDNKLITNQQQSTNTKTVIKSNWQQTGSTTDNTTDNKLKANRQQTGNKSTTIISFFSLVGLQKAILIAIYQVCKISRSHITDSLTLEFFVAQVNTDAKTIKTTLQRLEKKGCVIRVEFKNGRGGWSRYRLPDYIYNEILNLESVNKATTNWQQTSNKLVSEVASELITSPSSSSYSINTKNTTTSDNEPMLKLMEEWGGIDLEPLAEFGFTQTHLMQIARQGKLEQAIVQTSIYAFAFDLKHNDKHKGLKTNPVNYFMGILRNGQPYLPPSNYESPQDEALRLYVEKQREIEQRRAAIENEAVELAFKEWLGLLSQDEKDGMLSSLVKNLKSEQPKIAELKNHFLQNIWASQRQQLLKNN